MTDQTMQQNTYKNMLVAVSNAAFIRLVPTSEWMRIDYVEQPISTNTPGDVKVHLRDENSIGCPESTVLVSEINPETVSFMKLQEYRKLQEYSFGGMLFDTLSGS